MKALSTSMLFFTAMTTPAFAYLDPGTGSMILQAIIGALAVAGVAVSTFWSRIKAFFASTFSRKKGDQ